MASWDWWGMTLLRATNAIYTGSFIVIFTDLVVMARVTGSKLAYTAHNYIPFILHLFSQIQYYFLLVKLLFIMER